MDTVEYGSTTLKSLTPDGRPPSHRYKSLTTKSSPYLRTSHCTKLIMSAYSTLPFTPSVPVEPYKVDIPQSDVDDLKALLKLTRVPKETFENSRKHEEDYGITREWFQTARQAWMEFDW